MKNLLRPASLPLCFVALGLFFSCRSQQSPAATAGAPAQTPSATSTPTTATMGIHNSLTEAEKAAGYTLLFDGKNLDQWRGFKKDHLPAGWEAVDGELVLTGKPGDIVTKEEFDNFELLMEWKISPGGNSGVFFNVQEEEGQNAVFHTGPEIQILDDERHPDAKMGKDGNRTAGSNYDLIAPSAQVAYPVGQYNLMRVVVNRGQVQHWLNGVKIVEYQLGSPEWEQMVKGSKFASMPAYGRAGKGHIALQDHGDKVWFRNLKIRRL